MNTKTASLLVLGVALLLAAFGEVELGNLRFSPLARLPVLAQALFSGAGLALILSSIGLLLRDTDVLTQRGARMYFSVVAAVVPAAAVAAAALLPKPPLARELFQRWQLRPPGEAYVELNVAHLVEAGRTERVVVACRVTDPRVDPVHDPSLAISSLFEIASPTLKIAVPFSQDFMNRLWLSTERHVDCFVCLIPRSTDLSAIKSLYDIAQAGGEILDGKGINASEVRVEIDPDASPEIREQLEELIRKQSEATE